LQEHYSGCSNKSKGLYRLGGWFFNMRSIHSIFTDKEFKKIKTAKEDSGLSWHDFILKKLMED